MGSNLPFHSSVMCVHKKGYWHATYRQGCTKPLNALLGATSVMKGGQGPLHHRSAIDLPYQTNHSSTPDPLCPYLQIGLTDFVDLCLCICHFCRKTVKHCTTDWTPSHSRHSVYISNCYGGVHELVLAPFPVCCGGG